MNDPHRTASAPAEGSGQNTGDIAAETLATLVDSFPDPVCVVDRDLRITYANAATAPLAGMTQDELRQQRLQDLFAAEDHALFSAIPAELAVGEKTVMPEMHLRSGTDTATPVRLELSPLRENHDPATHIAVVLRDLRKWKEIEHALADTNRESAAGELAACIAHDISNPLSVTKLYVDWLKMDVQEAAADGSAKVPEGIQEGADAIEDATQRIEGVLNRLREFSSSLADDHRPVELRRVVQDAVRTEKNMLDRHGITVELDLPDSPCQASGRRDEYRVVFLHLITNAAEAIAARSDKNAQGRIHIGVEISNTADGPDPRSYICSVRDNGIGMDPKTRDTAHKMFFSQKSGAPGTGLGLTIVRSILRRQDGRIDMNSEPDVGTTVTVTIPAGLDDLDATIA